MNRIPEMSQLVHLCVFLALCQSSESFKSVMLGRMNPTKQNYMIFGSETSFLEKKSATVGGNYKPSDKFSSSKIVEEFIINKKIMPNPITQIGEDFKAPNPSIFAKSYPNEFNFSTALCQNRIRPMFEKMKVSNI